MDRKLTSHFLALLVATTTVAELAAQNPPAPSSAPASLSAQLITPKALYYPGEPMPVLFLLSNGGDSAIELEGLVPTSADGTALPDSFVFGAAGEPALEITCDNGRAETVTRSGVPFERGTLRIAPRGVLGLEVNLGDIHRPLRYSGTYRLEWHPPIPDVAPAVLNFRVEPRYDVRMQTDLGSLHFSLFYEQAPRNVENFIDLVRSRFYDGTSFHRILPDFLIQGGSPSGDPAATRPDGKLLPAEFHATPFKEGTLAMARKKDNPDSASCQFFITLGPAPDLDGQYTIIGQAADEGTLRTLRAIADQPTNERGQPLRPIPVTVATLVNVEPPVSSTRHAVAP